MGIIERNNSQLCWHNKEWMVTATSILSTKASENEIFAKKFVELLEILFLTFNLLLTSKAERLEAFKRFDSLLPFKPTHPELTPDIAALSRLKIIPAVQDTLINYDL